MTQDAAARGSGNALRFAASGIAAALLALVVLPGVPGLRDAEGAATGLAALAFSGAWIAAGVGALAGAATRRAAGWLALFAASQALWLATVDAGNQLGYDHWGVAEGSLRPRDVAALGFFAFQLGAVGLAARRARLFSRAWRWARERLGLGGIGVVAIVGLATTAHPNRDLVAYAVEVLGGSLHRALELATLALALDALGAETRTDLAQRAERLLAGPRSWLRCDPVAIGCALFSFAVASFLAYAVYERHPHVPDEVAYLWHAEYFARGLLRVPLPPVPGAFEAYLIHCDGLGCASPVPPGWPILLAVGAFLHVPWLVNPALAAAIVALLFRLLRDVYDLPTARLSALLLATSPWFLFLSMSVMTHNASLMWALVAAVASVRLWRGGRVAWAVVGGVALGFVSLVRPLEGVAASLVAGSVALLRPGSRLARLGTCTLLAVVAIAAGASQLVYNAELTGNPLVFPINAYTDSALGLGVNAIGFGPDKGVSWGGLDPFPGHGLRDVVVNSLLNGTALNQELFAWPMGSLLAVLLWIAMRRLDRRDAWLLAAAGLVVFLHAFYWFSGGPDFGARYWYLVLPSLVGLTARAVLGLGGTRSAAVVLVLSLVSFANFVPWRSADKYHDFRGMRPDMRELRERIGPVPALVLVRGGTSPDLSSALVYNPLDLRAPEPIFAWDRTPEVRSRLLAAYPDRPVYFVDGPTRTRRGFEIVAGPIAPGDALPPLRTDSEDGITW